MALKIEPNNSATAYHVNDGAVLFPYAVDAQQAVSRFPGEWRATPWSQADADAARAAMADEHAKLVADAKARGAPVPAPLPPPPPEPTPEEQAAIMEHAAAVAEAAARLKKFYAAEAEKKKIADQVAADEALVATPPPRPDPNARRPLTPAQLRKASATLTPAEQAEVDRKAAADAAAKKAADEKMAHDKAEADRLAAHPNAPLVR
jgi:hypothetical protein